MRIDSASPRAKAAHGGAGIPNAQVTYIRGRTQSQVSGDAYRLDDAESIAQIQNGVGRPLIPEVEAWLEGVILNTVVFRGTTPAEWQLTQDPNRRMMQP